MMNGVIRTSKSMPRLLGLREPALAVLVPLLSLSVLPALAQQRPQARSQAGFMMLQSRHVIVRIAANRQRLGKISVEDRATGRIIVLPEAFALTFKDGHVLGANAMREAGPLSVEKLTPDAKAERMSRREPGERVCAELADVKTSLRARWCGILREESAYFRQELRLEASGNDLTIAGVRMNDCIDPGARVAGTVEGSPITDSTAFFAIEFPFYRSQVVDGHLRQTLLRKLPLRAGERITYSSVVGVAPQGQMRRTFDLYLERERPRPYRPFLNYNTWYDLGYGNAKRDAAYDSAGAVDRIRAFGEELVVQRHVQLDSFVFDDGWDRTDTVWQFKAGFPHGFTPERAAAAHYGAGIGVWFSPWGGYDKEKPERVATGRKNGFAIVNDGLALSGPRYFPRFEAACRQMVEKYDVNYFKFDGLGNANQVVQGSQFDSDFDAAIHLVSALRAMKPALFINVTTGTQPSPSWLLYADSIWRGSADHSFAGVGSSRQRWITYRDAATYSDIVRRAPLFPLNSLMLHGIIFARDARGLKTDRDNDFADEVHSFFGSGTQAQELYITPSLLSVDNWNVLAQAARWSRSNAATLQDVHWIGGNPAALEVYGWAAWSHAEGIVTLRNPSDKAQTYRLDVAKAWQLPRGAALEYKAESPWDSTHETLILRAGTATVIKLRPFEVRTLQAQPVGDASVVR